MSHVVCRGCGYAVGTGHECPGPFAKGGEVAPKVIDAGDARACIAALALHLSRGIVAGGIVVEMMREELAENWLGEKTGARTLTLTYREVSS